MPRYVTFSSDEVNVSTTARQVGPATLVSHHHEGWQQVQRQMRMSFTEWQGAPGWEIGIPILFDGYALNVSQEGPILALETLGMPSSRFTPMRPPLVKFDSNGDIAHDLTRDPGKLWVIAGSGIEWGDYVSNSNMQRTRQVVTVHLWEFIGETVITVSLHNQTYVVKRGDTLMKIAQTFYGDKEQWRKIATANKIRDPNNVKVGKTIKLP